MNALIPQSTGGAISPSQQRGLQNGADQPKLPRFEQIHADAQAVVKQLEMNIDAMASRLNALGGTDVPPGSAQATPAPPEPSHVAGLLEMRIGELFNLTNRLAYQVNRLQAL